MEESKLVNLAIDGLWYLTKEQVEFYNNKVALTFVVYSEILSNSKGDKTDKLSSFAKKKLFENIVLAPMVAAKEGINMATKYNTNDAHTVFDGSRLNMRGMARVRIIMGLKNGETYDKKKNNDIHYAVSSVLKYLNFENTEFEDMSLFEIMVNFIHSRVQLYEGDEKMVANSFIESMDYKPVITCLNDCFERYIAKLLLEFEQETYKQGANVKTRKMPYKIYKKLSAQLSRRDYNSRIVLSSDLIQDIVNEFK